MQRPARAASRVPNEAGAALHRRRPRVVVRAPGATGPIPPAEGDRRKRVPTLPGLGFRVEADTIPFLEDFDDDEDGTPVSQVRSRVAPREFATRPAPRIPKAAPPPPSAVKKLARTRPVTLIDGVHDGLADEYRQEAARLLASGMFSRKA